MKEAVAVDGTGGMAEEGRWKPLQGQPILGKAETGALNDNALEPEDDLVRKSVV